MIQNKIFELFNKVYLNLLKDIKSKNDDIKTSLKINYKVFDKKSPEYVEYFSKLMNEEVTTQLFSIGEIFDCKDVLNMEIFLNVSVNQILNDVVVENVSDLKTFTYYMYILLLMCHMYNMKMDDDKKEILLSSVVSIISGVDTADTDSKEDFEKKCSDIMDDDIITVLQKIYDNRTSNVSMESNHTDFQDVPELDFLNNTKIGELVKEISKDIDLGKFNMDPGSMRMDNVAQMFESPDNMKAIGDIMQSVSAKFTDKLKSGEINNEELISEAMGMMGNLCNMEGGHDAGNMTSQMFDMMKNMQNMPNMPNMQNMPNMHESYSPTPHNSTKARLQKKLKDKQNCE